MELADITYRYLNETYRPKDDNLDEVGYHIGGFDTDGNPRVFHAFWGYDRPKPTGQEFPDNKFCNHHDCKFVYNGKNDLAHVVVEKLIEQLENNKDVRYDLSSLEGNIKFCGFVARFAAELTPEVGPPFRTFVIMNDNSIEEIKNDSFCPVEIDEKFITNPVSKPIILFHNESDNESPVSSLPTGSALPEELLDSSYKGGTISKLKYGGRIMVCSFCGTKYNDDENILGVVRLCPVCRKSV